MKYGKSKAPLSQEAWLTRNALLLCAGVFFSLVGRTTGGITVKRSPEASALYWPLEDTPQYTFEPFPFRLHEATKSSADHAIEQWSFRKARQFRPRLLKRRQQLRTDSSEIPAVSEGSDFGDKIPTRRIIDLSPPTDQEAVASSDNVRVIRRPISFALQRPERKTATSHSTPELPSSDGVPDMNKSISGGWVPVTEAPQVATTGKPTPATVESQVNQSEFVRSPPEILRRKLFNNTFNATTQKKKEEYWVSKIENAEIYKHSLPTRNTTNVLLNRLYTRFGLNSTVQTPADASTTPEQLILQHVTVEPVVSPSSSSVIIRGAANRTRLRVNRRPALSFTVQNPFSLGFLQVNITPPDPTPEPPHYDVEPSHRIDDTLDFQSVELDKGETKKEQVQESPIVLTVNPVVKEPEVQLGLLGPASEKPESNVVTSVLANELSSTVVTERVSSSGATSTVPATPPVANATQQVEIDKSETVSAAVQEVTEEPENADSRMFIPTSIQRLIKGGKSDSSTQLQTGESQSDGKSVVESILGVGFSQAPELRVNDSRSDESFQAVDAIVAMFAVESEVIVSRPIHDNSSISGSDLAQRNISLDPVQQNVNVTAPIDAAIEMPHLASARPGQAEMKPNGVVVDGKNATKDKQPQGIVGAVNFNTKGSETVNATEGHKLELATQSIDDFLFELPQSEVEVLRDSKRSRNNWTVRNDDLSRFNEEQRKIAPTVVDDEHDGAPEKVQNGTSVYFIGIIGIIPLAGCALYLAKILNRKRRERLHDSDTASVTGFRRGNALLHPLHLGQKKLLKPSGRHEGLDIIPQSRVSPWEFSRSKLKLMSVIGEGNFGQVWKAEAEEICGFDGRLIVAVKTIKEGATWREKEELLKEIQLMEQLGPHQNVVSILGCCTDHEPYYLIMEYVMAGRLLTYLRNHKLKKTYYNFSRDQENLSSRDLTSICYNVAKGMEFIASKGIIHRDLAARNVLIDHHKVAKVADFGLSRSVRDTGSEIYEQRSKGALPIRWMAPESLSQSLFTQKSDVWSFGIFIWEVITLGSTPYPGLSAREVMRRVREGSRLERPPHCKPELYKITTKCWATDPARRPDFSELRLELSKALDGSNDYVDFDKFHESHYCHLTPIKEGEEKL